MAWKVSGVKHVFECHVKNDIRLTARKTESSKRRQGERLEKSFDFKLAERGRSFSEKPQRRFDVPLRQASHGHPDPTRLLVEFVKANLSCK